VLVVHPGARSPLARIGLVATAPRLETETVSDLIKRILVGRRMATHQLEHTLLPKVLALPVFSSDALSSVAYATEQILFVLMASVTVTSATRLVMPISLAIATLMIIVVASYRQTVRAYPNGGGAYIVSKDNLGVLPGLIAAAALLTDYVLTVSVSVVAGVFAITSAVPSLHHLKVELSVGFVLLITLANLRGVRESGTLFAIPTYGFIASIYALILTGLVRCIDGGCPQAVVPTSHFAVGTASAVGLFVVLHAFSSGSTALTGVEAISNGVPAFRRPQARNAAQTLAIMGAIAVTMFVGISFLASRAHPLPSETKSVVAQIADGVFHGGSLYYVVQVFTAAILVLAANTSYQDFPRLASILARDRFLPRQFENRGDRLVFSNGVIVLAVVASVLIWVFDANLDRLIQLYVVGVFTSFTLSQTGMVRHWLKIKRERSTEVRGWRRSIVINGVGAVATFVVLVIVVQTKFVHGAWIVIAAMPVIVVGFQSIHRHYEGIWHQLRSGSAVLRADVKNVVVLYVEDLNAATTRAIGFVRSFAGRDFRAIHVVTRESPPDIAERWSSLYRTDVQLELLATANRRPTDAVIEYIRAIPRAEEDFVTVVIPELLAKRSLLAAVRRGMSFRLKVRLLREPQVAITDVPLLRDSLGPHPETRPLIPEHVEVLVFVAAVHDASLRAINYARSLKATETRAVYFAFEPAEIEAIQDEWEQAGIPVSLDIVEAPFRDLTAPVLDEVRQVTSRPGAVAVVVVPELVVKKWWHNFLHNQRPLFLKRLLLFEPNVILSSVPYQLR
jgi:amino acid transporter